MKTPRSLSKYLIIAASAGLMASPLSAAVLMLDFGPTVVTGTDRLNSPYHTANGSFTDVSWNQVLLADVAAGGLLYSDGSTATGVSLNLGATTAAGVTTISLTSQPSTSSALGSLTNTGVYAGNSVGKDGIFTGSGGASRYVGFQLGGLAAGTYDIYVASRNTSSSDTYSQSLSAGASSTVGNFNAATLSQTASVSFTGASDGVASWIDTDNYMKLTVTLTSGQYLNLAVIGSGPEGRGFLNSVQIVSVPEPSSFFLLASAGMFLTILRRKR